MADEGGGSFITQKVGPLPLVVWVIGGAGVVFVFLAMKGKGSSGPQANATNQLSALAPNEAEAFGTIEQQQQDVSNALSTLGNNQSALGGSLGTLAGTIDTNQNFNAAQFGNILGGLAQVQQGQGVASDQASAYNQSIMQALANYYASLNTTVTNGNQNLSQQVSGVSNQINGVSTQVGSSSAAQQDYFQRLYDQNNQQTAYLGNLDQAGINATWSQYNTIMHTIGHALGVPGM